MSRKLRMGVVGLGMGRGHARGYQSHPESELDHKCGKQHSRNSPQAPKPVKGPYDTLFKILLKYYGLGIYGDISYTDKKGDQSNQDNQPFHMRHESQEKKAKHKGRKGEKQWKSAVESGDEPTRNDQPDQ